jgi:hypothetical protein
MSLLSHDDYMMSQKIEQMVAQIEIAVRALHVIAVMADLDSAQTSQMALDCLKEMEIEGMLYDFYEESEE